MCDKLVYDLSQEIEGSPNVFVRKDWVNILDNKNQNYSDNQSVIDTSQLSNSNKYMSYREAYLSIPFLVSLASITSQADLDGTGLAAEDFYFKPLEPLLNTDPVLPPEANTYRYGRGADYAIGLKNWFGQIIHSFTLDYNGTTIIQQTPFINMWNSFRLLTSLSLDDINTQGATIGFYPDDATSWQFTQSATAQPFGQGVCNNSNYIQSVPTFKTQNTYNGGLGNEGFLRRQQLINFNGLARIGGPILSATGLPPPETYSTLINGGATGNGSISTFTNIWKSYIFNKINQTAAVDGLLQYAIVATVYLKHVHSFFNMCPLLKGVFMKMTMNLNNTTTTFNTYTVCDNVANTVRPSALICTSVQNPLGGVNPLMIAAGSDKGGVAAVDSDAYLTQASTNSGGTSLFPFTSSGVVAADGTAKLGYRVNMSVGARCLDPEIRGIAGALEGPLSKSIYLYIPSYIFNPVFEQAYLSSPVKQIKYTDVYQYQVLGIGPGQNFSNLLTNGIANVKSVLILPFFSTNANQGTTTLEVDGVATNILINQNTGFLSGIPVWQSPFDPAGTGPTSPMAWLSNFNIQISGQNAIYNTQRYNFEQFNNQLYGQNAVNGGLTDGITSGLIDRQKFDMEYCYYYVNVERMLPVEQAVPKSVQIIGTNQSSKFLDLICFIEYGVEGVSIDVLSGARV